MQESSCSGSLFLMDGRCHNACDKRPRPKNHSQCNHYPDNVKFPNGSRHASVALDMLSVTHIMPVQVLLSVVGVGMQQYMIRNHTFNI